MSFIGAVKQGTTYAPGFFLAQGDEEVIRETREIAQNDAAVVTTADGKYVPMGTLYSKTVEGTTEYIGLLYEDVDVTSGNMPGSVVTGNAVVYEDRLPASLASAAKTALAAKGFTFIASAPAVTRPNWVNS